MLIVTPEVGSDHKVKPRVSVLTPAFEATRARQLPIPAQGNLSFYEWPEDVDPYKVAISAFSGQQGIVYVDGAVRKFIADGLASAGGSVLSAPLELRSLRERKSPAELDIIRCASEVNASTLQL